MLIVYLGIDGVLHPKDVVLAFRRPPKLRGAGHVLFEYAPLLDSVLEDYPEACVVLHSWWVYYLGYKATLRYCTPVLKSRVRGATTPGILISRGRNATSTRREWLVKDAARRGAAPHMLIDWDPIQILPGLSDSAVLLDGTLGLTSPGAIDAIRFLLATASHGSDRP